MRSRRRLRNTTKKSSISNKYWAVYQEYFPFVMGGTVWQPRRYEITGEPVSVGKLKCFMFYNTIEKAWQCHECDTGGLLASGLSREEAVRTALQNCSITPDIAEQIKAMKPAIEKKISDKEPEDVWRMIENGRRARV